MKNKNGCLSNYEIWHIEESSSEVDAEGGSRSQNEVNRGREPAASAGDEDSIGKEDPDRDPDSIMLNKKRKKARLWTAFYCCCKKEDDSDPAAEVDDIKSRAEVNRLFYEQQTLELWIIYLIKCCTAMIFLIDDLTFLLYCEAEYHMSQSEAGLLYMTTAICLFIYAIVLAGPIIDKIGVKLA